MSTSATRQRRHPPRRAPRPLGVRVRRRWSSTRRRAYRLLKRVRERLRPRGYAGVEKTPRWRSTWRDRMSTLRVTLLGALLVALVARAVWIVINGTPAEWPFGFNPDGACRDTSYSCGIASGVLMSILTVAFAAALFLWLRLRRVRSAIVGRARDEPRELVETAGTIVGNVVGRDELCNVIMDDLKDRAHRRPHIVLGGVGVGKTAVILELTKRLAERGAVPVPVRLRDAQDGLDFRALAEKRFTRELRRTARSDAEAERAWRELRNADQIVVLADGLEEALTADGDEASGDGDRDGSTERDNQIRVAFRAVQRERLPLVVASRPHDALVGLDAAVVALEPLGEEAALEYIEADASTHDKHRLDWVIETANVTETPLYLQLARELHAVGLLENALPESDDERYDTGRQDRVGLRVHLLETWMRALEDGSFHRDVPFSKPLRRATIAQLGVLACAGLLNDTIEVRFDQVFAEHAPDDRRSGPRNQMVAVLQQTVERLYQSEEFAGRRAKGEHLLRRELRLAASRGVRLRLVESRGQGVRFPHSILQAYLASRVLPALLDGGELGFLKAGLRSPSRELLAALVMESRGLRRSPAALERGSRVVEALREAVRGQGTARALDVAIAALEVDSAQNDRDHDELAGMLEQYWPAENEDRTVEEAKLNAVRRFGEVARKVADLGRQDGRADEPAYAKLYAIACKDLWYPVRVAAAQELGRGRDEVFVQLGGGVWSASDKRFHFDARDLVVRLGPFLDTDVPEGDLPRDMDMERARSHLPARYAGDGWQDRAGHRELVVRAWLAPLLVNSVRDHRKLARENLDLWLHYARPDGDGRDSRLPISLEIALAQGFKHAANRRLGRTRAENEARAYLAARAVEMLEHARFWFSRLALVQAMCLWVLSDPDLTREGSIAPPHDGRGRLRRIATTERRGSDPAALIDHWLSSPLGGREHPFVAEARDLAVLAIEKRQPERFIWIDESGVVSKIGSRPPPLEAHRKHNLWIPPSMGWSALHPRAQRLVADVLILLNLVERGDDLPADRERRLRHAKRDDLPACLAGTRAYLDASRTVGTVEIPAPGARCKDGCAFDLCPYPPKGPSQTYRVELSEAFCRRQQVLIGRWPWPLGVRTASWQGAVPSELKHFWMEMEERARL